MRKKSTILVVALFLITAVVLVLLDRNTPQTTAPTAPQELSDEQTADVAQDVTAITYSDGAHTLRFARGTDGAWRWTDAESFPLDGSYPDRVAATVKNLTVLSTIPVTDEAPLSSYGLDTSAVYLTYTTAAGTVTLTIGKQDDAGNYYFSRSDDEANVYLTDGTLREELSLPIQNMMVLPSFPVISAEKIRTVTVTGANGTSVALSVAAQEKNAVWTCAGADVTTRGEITALQAEMAGYAMDSCLDYAPSESAYPLCGLDAPAATLSMTYVNTVNAEATVTMTLGAQRGDNYCAMLSGDSTIYLISSSKVAALLSLAANGLPA
jgi:hypothetical protein